MGETERQRRAREHKYCVQWMNPEGAPLSILCTGLGLWGCIDTWLDARRDVGLLLFYLAFLLGGLLPALFSFGVAKSDVQGVRLWKPWVRMRLSWKEVRSVCPFKVTQRGGRIVPYLLISTLEKPWEAPVRRLGSRRFCNYWRNGTDTTLILYAGEKMRHAVWSNRPLLTWKPLGFDHGKLFDLCAAHARPRKAARKEKKP